jgi:hypothetical protein
MIASVHVEFVVGSKKPQSQSLTSLAALETWEDQTSSTYKSKWKWAEAAMPTSHTATTNTKFNEDNWPLLLQPPAPKFEEKTYIGLITLV